MNRQDAKKAKRDLGRDRPRLTASSLTPGSRFPFHVASQLARMGVSRALCCLLIGVLCVLAVQSQSAEPQPRRITHDGKRKEDLAWSPDGKLLACSLYHQKGRVGIAVMNADGSDVKVLTKDPVERAPSWSPDGKRLVFVHVTQSGTDGELDLHQMNVDGTERKVLVGGKAFDNFPSWSPDGKKLLFTTTRDKTQEIYTADADGGSLKRLTSEPCLKQFPRWSPDGKQILFAANREGSLDLWVMNADGSQIRRLTDDPSTETCPAWSPDGRRIAFATMRDENWEIYVMNVDGSAAANVSRAPGYDFSPAWMPDGRTLTWVSDRDGKLDVYALTLP